MQASGFDDSVMHADLARFLRYYRSLAQGRPMPRYGDFRPADVSWLLGKLYVMDVLDGGADYRFRLLGAALTRLHGCDHTGKRLSDVEYPGLSNPLRAEMAMLLKLRKPLLQRGRVVWSECGSIGAEKLLVPLTDDAGELAVILGALHYEHPDEDWVLFKGGGVPSLAFDLEHATAID